MVRLLQRSTLRVTETTSSLDMLLNILKKKKMHVGESTV